MYDGRADRAAGAGQVRGVHAGQRRGDGAAQRGSGAVARELGQAEVEHLDAIAMGDEQVGRLDVPVDDAAAVRRVERLGDLPGEVQHARGGQRPFFDQLLDGAPLEQLHHDERLAVVFAELVNRADVRVLQRRRQAGLALESGQPLGGRDRLGAQQLDGDFAAKLEVFGAIDHAHATFAEGVQQAIV